MGHSAKGDDAALGDYGHHLVEELHAGRLTRREFARRASVAGLSLLGANALLGAPAAGAANRASRAGALFGAVPKRGGTLKVGLVAPATDLDPVTTYSTFSLLQIAGEYLAFPRPDYTLAPVLATGWKATTPTEWTFKLRQGVKFHDGSALTADDVVATFDRLTDPATKSAALSAFSGILSKGNTEKVDAYTVKFHLDRAYVDFPYLVSAFNYNAIILPKNYEIGEFMKGGVGTGPYVLTQTNGTQGVTFTKNQHYWDPNLPYLDGVQAVYYADVAPEVLALQAGAIDVYHELPFQGSQALFHDKNIAIYHTSSSQYQRLRMHVDKAPFTDHRVREAIALCIDRPALIKLLLGGRGKIGNDHPFAPIFPVDTLATHKLPQRKQDYKRARHLLAQAGHAHGLNLTLIAEKFIEIPQYAVAVQQMCKPAGIHIKVQVEDTTTYFGSGNNQPWLQAPFAITGWAPRGNASAVVEAGFPCAAAWNESKFCSTPFDKLLTEFDATLDNKKRQNLALSAARIQHDSCNSVIAYWIDQLRAARKNVHGLPAGPASHLDLRSVWLA